MNTHPTPQSKNLRSESLSYETRSAVYEDAKRRAQLLRRDAISGLIADVVAWFASRLRGAQRPMQSRLEASCRS